MSLPVTFNATMLSASLVIGAVMQTQPPQCAPAIDTTTVAERTFQVVAPREFEGRAYLYVPQIFRSPQQRFQPFELWIVEGIYGRPFVQSHGLMMLEDFERLRKNSNVRAVPVRVQQNGQSERVTVARRSFQIEVSVAMPVNSASIVTARICPVR